MISKINNSNISFKAIYPLPSMARITEKDLFRLMPVINMADQYPQNDIFLGLNSKKQLYIEVHKIDDSTEILDEEVLKKSNFKTEQLINFAYLADALKATYKKLHQDNLCRVITPQTISQMSMFDMALAINDAVQNCNNNPLNKSN